MPDLENFTLYFTELKYTHTLDKDLTDYVAVRYFINKMNVHNNTNAKYFDRNCSIEHIIPGDKDNELTWNIGNLIPLESFLNEKLGDDNYDFKRIGYMDSKYEEFLSFIKEHQIWEEEQITERAKILAEYFYNEILSSSLEKINDVTNLTYSSIHFSSQLKILTKIFPNILLFKSLKFETKSKLTTIDKNH